MTMYEICLQCKGPVEWQINGKWFCRRCGITIGSIKTEGNISKLA